MPDFARNAPDVLLYLVMHRVLSFIIVLVCLACLTAHAQENKPAQKPAERDDVVRVNTELVQTDVTVFDKDGRVVTGLEREQFELFVDGQRQPIAFFESVVTGGRNEDAALKAVRGSKPAPSAIADPDSTERGRTIVFFINDLNLEPGSLARTHKTVKHFIDYMLGPNDQVAITSASGQIGFLQQLTDNPIVLRAALERLKYVPGAMRDGERPAMNEYAAFLIAERNDRALFEYFVQQTMKANNADGGIASAIVERRARAIIRQSDAVVKVALSSLVNLLNSTGKLPGRKLVFFMSDGFVPNFRGSDFTDMMLRATGAAASSGVVIYSLDARGLSNDSSLDASNSGGADPYGVLSSRMSGERTFSQEPLHALAADTGGRALLNSNALEDGIARALDETSRYYLLSWRPESNAQRAPNFPKIKITIAGRPDLKVQLRRGYLGARAEQSKPNTQSASVQLESKDLVALPESSTVELRTALFVGYKQTPGKTMQLTSSIQVSAQSLSESGSASGKADTNVLGAVFDSRGKAVGSFKQRLDVPRSHGQATPAYVNFNHQVEVAPGLYQVRIIATERGSGRINGAMEWIEIPGIKAVAFSISSLYTGEIVNSGNTGQVGVNASRRFARTSRLRFTTYIYNAAHSASPPHLGVQTKILRGEQAVITPPETKVSTEKLTDFTNITYTGEFPLNALPVGSYVLEVTVTDRTATASASQRFKFTVY